ncbi:class I SAM-dependent methyltransferase [Sphingomicrobium marinum]|uniref:class I SAM-dependent methyltransferase n=1 Tax=Sphingomicrobium marinum TaxID=1227950 RepID=UPI002240640A|nr:class I SAM-dependent methyltransferase [Sphingomicrobium marinum]
MEREIYDAMDATEAEHWWFEGRRDVLQALIEKQVKPGPEARILDAGCGTGGNLAFLRQFGSVDACEYDDAARAIAARKSGIQVAPARLPDDLSQVGEGYDLITLLDVLEHLQDDVGSLEALRSRLAPGGKLLITVPALPWLWSEHDEKHHHHRRYTPATLRKVLNAAGMKGHRMGYMNSLLLPLAIAQRGASKLSRKAADAGDMPPKWLNGPLRSIFSFEAKLVNRLKLPPGLSLYAVASA